MWIWSKRSAHHQETEKTCTYKKYETPGSVVDSVMPNSMRIAKNWPAVLMNAVDRVTIANAMATAGTYPTLLSAMRRRITMRALPSI